MTYQKTLLVMLASLCLLSLPATQVSWASGYDDDDDDDDGFKDFFDAFFDKLFKKIKKIKKLALQNNATLTDHEIRITDLESITVVNGTDGQDGADGMDGINGTNGTDGINGINGTDGLDGQDGADGSQGIPGVNGTDGTDGMDGQDGADGTVALYKVEEISEILAGYHIYEASCDAGDYAISGGYVVDAEEDASQIFIDRDNGAGSLFGEMWTIGLLNDGNLDLGAEITVTAVCQDNP